ncbi:MAG TPA: sigma-70 family RNA polymerase sigma factor [Gemmatimonadales bacterium]|nr:sigma-70 family RNA polymerase sigma factor [Gemmatimonadales bacterium]
MYRPGPLRQVPDDHLARSPDRAQDSAIQSTHGGLSSGPFVIQPSAPSTSTTDRTAAPAPATFESLFTAVMGSAYGIAMRYCQNKADAEDLVQEAAFLAYRAFDSFETGSNFRAWFLKILTNCYFSKRRREKSRPVTSDLDDTPDLYIYARSGQAGFPTQGPDPASQLLEALGTERIVAAIHRLPEDYRVVSTLYFMEDLSYEEIARILECPVGTVRSRLHRGRKMLQKALWQVAEEDGIVGDPGGGRGT